MKIYLGTDHAGFELKEKIKSFLLEKSFDIEDCGAFTFDKNDDYPDFISKAAIKVSQNSSSFGIVFGKSGAGECITANKIKGIRAILGFSVENVKLAREHNDANVLCLGAWVNPVEVNLDIVRAWFATPFGEGRHVRRVEKMSGHSREKIVFTNGIFDILHKGHIELFKFAKSLGGRLVVGINFDRATKLLKGKNRPINSAPERKATLENIQYIDQVVIFDDTKTVDIISDIKPHIVVKGGEWTAEEVRTRDRIPKNIEVKVCPLVMQASGIKYSSTNVIEKIKSR